MNPRTSKLFWLALMMFLWTAAAAGQSAVKQADTYSKAEREVLAANEEYDKAIVARDAAAYQRILGDDFIFTSFNGTVSNKAQELEKVKQGDLTFEAGKSDDLRVKVYGKTAVVTGRFVAKGQSKGKPFTFTERYTGVFVKRDGRWQLVAEHANEIAQK
jgi:ketosteroid isomerase-like protein